MKLLVTAAREGEMAGKVLVMRDEHGVALPNQIALTTMAEAPEAGVAVTYVTVTFIVDGKDVILA